MFCAISGSVPEDPVITKDGYIFERRLIEKHVQDTGKHPITGEDLSVDDLIQLKSNKSVKPRPAPAASIPGLLGIFHNEWDALMLETHQLRQALNASRQELAHALYQHDSASRVVARLIRERDEARKALESASVVAAATESANGKRPVEDGEAGPSKRARAEEAPGGFGPELRAMMEDSSKHLSKGRKKRAISVELATPETLAAFTLLASQPLHKTSKGGILAIATSPDTDTVVATAGMDGQAHIFDRAAGRIVGELQGHSKKVNDVKFMGRQDRLVTASADKTARIWKADADGTFTAAAVLMDHTAEVTAVSVHPLTDYFVTASLDKTWCFYDGNAGIALAKVTDEGLEGGFSSAEFHPDGVLLGTGTEEGLVRVWDVKGQKNVAKFEGHRGAICGLSFSENGYYLATCASDGVKLWDLRKLKNFKTITPYGEGSGASSVAFDTSGLYLAVGGADARVYGAKQEWDVIKTFPDQPKKGVYSVKWGTDAKTLFVGAADHNLRIYGTA